MKKIITTTLLVGTTFIVFAQEKKVTDTVQISFNKDVAIKIVEGLQAGAKSASLSKDISAFDASQSVGVASFFIGAIYKKWPELIPKQK